MEVHWNNLGMVRWLANPQYKFLVVEKQSFPTWEDNGCVYYPCALGLDPELRLSPGESRRNLVAIQVERD